MTPTDIDHLHHVGHLVQDMAKGLDLYQRLGFQMTPPSFPTVALSKGAPLTPFGAGNSHADFNDNNFVELATAVDGHQPVPDNATFVPLQVPDEALPQFLQVLNRTIATLNACLARFEGLHILVLGTPDVDAQAIRLSREGIRHSGVASSQQQSPDQKRSPTNVVRVIEIDDPDHPVPEGRLAIAESVKRSGSHPNGALGLVESILCVPEAELSDFDHRYGKYTNHIARKNGKSSVFELGHSRITIVADSALDTVLPGEHLLALPGFVAYVVRVSDLNRTRQLLLKNGFSPKTTTAGDVFVSAREALGAAVVFRAAEH